MGFQTFYAYFQRFSACFEGTRRLLKMFWVRGGGGGGSVTFFRDFRMLKINVHHGEIDGVNCPKAITITKPSKTY